jgi:hypothetical protein
MVLYKRETSESKACGAEGRIRAALVFRCPADLLWLLLNP